MVIISLKSGSSDLLTNFCFTWKNTCVLYTMRIEGCKLFIEIKGARTHRLFTERIHGREEHHHDEDGVKVETWLAPFDGYLMLFTCRSSLETE